MYWIDISDEWQDRNALDCEIEQLRAMADVLSSYSQAEAAAWCRIKAAELNYEYQAPFDLEIIY